MQLEVLLGQMWSDYCDLNPAAKRVYDLLTAEGEEVLNDHIALRTLRHPRLGIESMAQVFKKLGYKEMQDYHFKEKKLYAKHYEHADETKPKIFISELLLEALSSESQKSLGTLAEEIPQRVLESETFTYSGRSWFLTYRTYEALAKESEYAAWVAAIGFRPNHFTVFVNNLKKYNTIERMNQFLEEKGYRLNASGGKIKGSPAELLEQSSIMAELVTVDFKEGSYPVPGCYYEFARRYPDSTGRMYQGFVTRSADRIFESTHRA